MGKISPVSAKYIVHAHIQIDGVVDRPDVIGAIFGQTEGLLGDDLELRELQRSGRIGRIEVKSEVVGGKTSGDIIIPSSLDKAETAIVAAALETIQRIGPCNAKVNVKNIEDVRISKRGYVVDRAKDLLKSLSQELPDSQEMTEKVSEGMRISGVVEIGPDRLPAGPDVATNEELILVEGRADIVNLLRHGIKNAVALNGTSCPPSITDLCKNKKVTIFVDGDRGGNLIIKEVSGVAKVDFVAKAPDGKEVEEITQKEILQALRAKVPLSEANLESVPRTPYRPTSYVPRPNNVRPSSMRPGPRGMDRRPLRPSNKVIKVGVVEKKKYKTMLDDLIGTRGAYILDQELNILGKVPTSELSGTIKSLGSGMHSVVFDGSITKEITEVADRNGLKCVVAMTSRVKPEEARVKLLTKKDLAI